MAAAFVPVSGAAAVGAAGALLLQKSGAQVTTTRFFPVALTTSRGAFAPLAPEGTKGLLLEAAANLRSGLSVSVSKGDATALGLVPPAVLEGTKVPAPTENLRCFLAAAPCVGQESAAFGLLDLAVQEGTKGPVPAPRANLRCFLAAAPCVGQESAAFGLLDLAVQEGTKGLIPTPVAIFCNPHDSVGHLLALPLPEGTNAVLPAPAAIIRFSAEDQDSLGLVALAVPEGTKAGFASPAADAEDSTALGLAALAVPEGTKAVTFRFIEDSQDTSPMGVLNIGCGFLTVPEGTKVGGGHLPVSKLRVPVVRCCARPTAAGMPSAGIAGQRGLLSVSGPQELGWGLFPEANRHVLIARCSSKPAGEPAGDSFVPLDLDTVPRFVNSSALVGHPEILKEFEDSATTILAVVKEFTPMLVDYILEDPLTEYAKVFYRNKRMGFVPFIEERASHIAIDVEMVRAEATEGYVREESVVAAIIEVRTEASRFLRHPRFGRAVDLLPAPYAGTVPKAHDKVVHFTKLAEEMRCIALALDAGLLELRKV